ncbi:MAG: UvrD-helicase domain-containing protein [Erysipelotrichaceae bacterium]|nr:UvrD-helicase domain-containing protein [Erysipelotrichaceae bacterium]
MDSLQVYSGCIDAYLASRNYDLKRFTNNKLIGYHFGVDDRYLVFYLVENDNQVFFYYRLDVNSIEKARINITDYNESQFESFILPIVSKAIESKPEIIQKKGIKNNEQKPPGTKKQLTDKKDKNNSNEVNVRKTKKQYTDQQIAYDIYDTIAELNKKRRFCGTFVLVDVLRGSRAQRVIERRLFDVNCYGKYKSLSKSRLSNIVNQLIDQKVLAKSEGVYPVLVIRGSKESISLLDNTSRQIIEEKKIPDESAIGMFFSVEDEPYEQNTEFVINKNKIDNILNNNNYISRSDYTKTIDEVKDYLKQVSFLIENNLLENYCKNNGIEVNDCIKLIDKVNRIEDLVRNHNDKYIQEAMNEEKDYLDNVLKDIDPIINLDDDQRKVVLTDEDNCLVIAGAGAGKTTTVAAKVKYLVDKKGINPEDILVISFTNKAVEELRERINDCLGIPCKISTFHSIGYSIMKEHTEKRINIVDDVKLFYVLDDYLKKEVLKDESMVNLLITFFASYFDAPVNMEEKELKDFFNNIAKANYTTLRSDLDEVSEEITDNLTRQKRTINNEVLRSYQEVRIANFLYLNNIDYEYEPLYDCL